MVLVNDLTFVLNDTGVVLNDSSTLPFIDIDSVKGLNSAPYRTTQRDHEGDDGGYMDAEFEKGRDIVLEGTIYADSSTIESYLDTLKGNWAPSSAQIPFYYKAPGVAERLLFVKPLGVSYDWDAARRLGICAVQFSCFAEDPRIYTSQLLTSSAVHLGATVFVGFGFSFGFPLSFGGVSSTTDQVTIAVDGNRPTPPVFTITGPVDNPRILNDTTSSEMIFSGISLSGTDTLTVDTKNKSVLLNGTANRRNTLQAPTWFYLQPGTNSLRFRATSSDPTATLVAQYRAAWR
jgi:hypothetical protein